MFGKLNALFSDEELAIMGGRDRPADPWGMPPLAGSSTTLKSVLSRRTSQEIPMRVFCIAIVLLFAAMPAQAQTNPSAQEHADARADLTARISDVEAQLKRLNEEQQSVRQNIQVVEEMRRSEQQSLQYSAQANTAPPTPPNYDDIVREKQARESRLQSYASEMDRLYARYRELEEQKRPLLDQLTDLTRQRR